MSGTNINIPNGFGLSDSDIKAIREHETRMRDEATRLYGYRSEESYVAMYHDEVVYGLRSIESIRMYLLKNESKKDPTLTREKVNSIIEAVKAVTRYRASLGDCSVLTFTEDMDGYYSRLTDNVSAWRIKKLCLADQLEHGLILNEYTNADCVYSEGYDDWRDHFRELDELIDDALNLTLPFSGKTRRGLLSRAATHTLGQVVMYTIGVSGAVMLCAAAWPAIEVVFRAMRSGASVPDWVVFIVCFACIYLFVHGTARLLSFLSGRLTGKSAK